jgi:ABC-2 type transport system ATP-binding protein
VTAINREVISAGRPLAGAEPSIEAAGLTKRYGDTVAVDGVGFMVAAGEIFGYLGRNGSGKTTTVRMLTTLTRPTAGTARICGVAVSDPGRVRSLIGVTLQEAALDPAMTTVAHLRFIAGLWGMSKDAARARAAEVLEIVGLTDHGGQRIRTFSGGMQRRLDIATALLGRPAVLFLDEPTTGLDPQSRRAVWEEIRKLRDGGVAVFLTTQYLEEADRLADRVAVVDSGRIVATGTPAQLKAAHGRTVITIGRHADGRCVADLLAPAQVSLDEAGRTVVTLEGSADATATLNVLDRLRSGGVDITSLGVAETSLEDVFVHLTGATIGDDGTADRP